MKRRSDAISGWVNFPVNDPAWENSREGGMFVKLVVCDRRDDDTEFAQCCGAFVTDVLGETFVGDDRRPKPLPPETYESLEALQAEQDAMRAWQAHHFPGLNRPSDVQGIERYLSRDYLAVVVLGTTGWSGWNPTEGRGWECRFGDLTDEGKALYRQMEALYPGSELHLLTFLDT